VGGLGRGDGAEEIIWGFFWGFCGGWIFFFGWNVVFGENF
jgi:hypothetical protein